MLAPMPAPNQINVGQAKKSSGQPTQCVNKLKKEFIQ